MASVFISYRHIEPDQSIAKMLYQYLADLDHDVFFDASGIPVGAFWHKEISVNIERAEWFIPLVSLAYLNSTYILSHELAPAAKLLKIEKIKGILQINLAYDGKPPEEVREVLTQIQFLKWHSKDDTSWIMKEIGSHIPAAQIIIKGMKAFDTSDNDRFSKLGREDDLKNCLELIRSTRRSLSPKIILLHGVSGAGKTSFIRAGLIPQLQAENNSRSVIYAISDTNLNLQQFILEKLGDIPPGNCEVLEEHSSAIVFLDQFEQWMIHYANQDEEFRQSFIRNLDQWINTFTSITLVFCLRDEFRNAFDIMLTPLSNVCHRFILLPFYPKVAAAVLSQLLESVKIEFDNIYSHHLCEELAEGVPPTIRPAILQLIAQYCRNNRIPLNKESWEGTHSLSHSLFEVHVKETILDQLPWHPIWQLGATQVLSSLTRGEVKAGPKTTEEIIEELQVGRKIVCRTLELAAMPHARIVATDAEGTTAPIKYQLIHDLFANGIQTLHRTVLQRWEWWRRTGFLIASIILIVIIPIIIFSIQHQTERQGEVLRLVGIVQELAKTGQYLTANNLLQQAETMLPSMPEVLKARSTITGILDLIVEPKTAKVQYRYWDSWKKTFSTDWQDWKPGEKLLYGAYVIRIEQDDYLIRDLSLTILEEKNELPIDLINILSLKLPSDVQIRDGKLFRMKDDAELVYIPAGQFWMGSDNKLDGVIGESVKPKHEVKMSAYLIDKYEVTMKQWRSYINAPNVYNGGEKDENLPVADLSWNAAYNYVMWINGLKDKEVPKKYLLGQWSLPTEAQWERAAQPAFGGVYPWGPNADKTRCNGLGQEADGFPKAAPVGSFPQGMSVWGVHDLIGNVFEYTWNWNAPYDSEPETNPVGPLEGENKIYRGGAWNNVPSFCTLVSRFSDEPTSESFIRGFRIATSLP